MAKSRKFVSTSFSFSYFDEDLICKETFLKFLDKWSPCNHNLGVRKGTYIHWHGGDVLFATKDEHILALANPRRFKLYKIADAVYSWRGRSSPKGSFYVFIDTAKVWPNEKPDFFLK